jgi:pyruvate ferredoxin oxidoreductase gamma subunit
MGAPVTSFCRISSQPIRVREPVTHPHALVILDATLLHHVDVFGGLEDGGYVLINSVRSIADLGVESIVDRVGTDHFGVITATDLAIECTGAPRPNVAALGSLAALTGAVSLASIEQALLSRFGAAAHDNNVRLARAGFEAMTAVARA